MFTKLQSQTPGETAARAPPTTLATQGGGRTKGAVQITASDFEE